MTDLNETKVWDTLDDYVRQVPTAKLEVAWLTQMLAELYEIEELDPDMPKQPHVVDHYAALRGHVRSWLEKGGSLKKLDG